MTKTKDNNLKFIDFCAGIGGGRLGLENLGMQCVGFSEIDKKAEETYREFFGSGEIRITNRGSLKIGKIGMQRKGGDNGRDTAKMLQFKINPVELFNK